MRNILSFHKKSKYAEEEETSRPVSAKSNIVPKKKKKVFTLPHWWLYIAWFSKYSAYLTDGSTSPGSISIQPTSLVDIHHLVQ